MKANKRTNEKQRKRLLKSTADQ